VIGGRDAVAQTERLQPDVILLDLEMRISRCGPPPPAPRIGARRPPHRPDPHGPGQLSGDGARGRRGCVRLQGEPRARLAPAIQGSPDRASARPCSLLTAGWRDRTGESRSLGDTSRRPHAGQVACARRLVLIGDSAPFRQTLARLLRVAGHMVWEARVGRRLALLRQHPLDLV